MRLYKISDFKIGWFVGNFEPSLIKNSEFEIGVKSYSQGQRERKHMQLKATEITVVISGIVRIGNLQLVSGDVLVIQPLEEADFEAITDCVLVCVKSPSDPQDKVITE